MSFYDALLFSKGQRGKQGYSAYEIAVQNGYEGTEEEWANSFLSPTGYYTKTETDNKLNKKAYYFDNVASMKNATNLKDGDYVITLGYYEANDGGAGEYEIVNDATLVDDGGSVHNLTNGLKAKLIIKNSVNVRQFGAKGDYQTDDTVAFQNALNISKDVFVPEGIFMIRSIYLSNKQNLHGNYPSSRLQCIAEDREDNEYMIYIRDTAERVNISGFHFGGNGRLSNIRVGCIRAIGSDSWHGQGYISNCYFTSFSGSAIYLDKKVNGYFMNDLSIISMRSGIVVNATDCNISSCTIGGIDEEGLYLGGDNFVSGVKCWLCGKFSDENNKYYALHMISNNTVIGYYGQQNIYDDIRIDGDGNKIEFTSNMDGDRKTLTDVSIISISENANYNQVKGVITQGKSGAYFDYILKFEGEKNQVGNNFEFVVYNYLQNYDIKLKNATVHHSNVIKVDNRDYSCKAENLINDETMLHINYANLSDVARITKNENDEFIYNYPISLADLEKNEGCFMVYKFGEYNFSNKSKVFISFDADSNVETYHKQFWLCFGVKPSTYSRVNPVSKFKDMKNKWHYDCVINIPDTGLHSIRIGLFLEKDPQVDFLYPSETNIKISNLEIRVI